MAETTATTPVPCFLTSAMRRATFWIIPASPTEEPPYLWITSDMMEFLFLAYQMGALNRGLSNADVTLNAGLAGGFGHLIGHGHLPAFG